MPLRNEEKNEKKLPQFPENSENSIQTASAQNFNKCQQSFSQGMTLEDYLKNNSYSGNELAIEKQGNQFNKLKTIIPKITEQSELSFDNSEKKYLEASFEINESDEDLYNNSDSNSNKSNHQEKKSNKNYENNDNIIELPNQEQEELKNKIKVKYTSKKKISKKQNSLKRFDENEFLPLRDYEKKNSLKLTNQDRDANFEDFGEKIDKFPSKDNCETGNNEQRENRMKSSNKQSKKIYNSQSPPHSNVLQNNMTERRNFSKDTFVKYSQEDKLHNYSSKENIENHIAYRNSFDPNKTHSLLSGQPKEKKEETKFGNFYNNNNNEFNKSSYNNNNKSRLTLNEFYKNQSKYQDFGNPMGPPAKMKSWISMNSDLEFERKYCDKDKIKEKMRNEDLNLLTKYASKFKLNEEECI